MVIMVGCGSGPVWEVVRGHKVDLTVDTVGKRRVINYVGWRRLKTCFMVTSMYFHTLNIHFPVNVKYILGKLLQG